MGIFCDNNLIYEAKNSYLLILIRDSGYLLIAQSQTLGRSDRKTHPKIYTYTKKLLGHELNLHSKTAFQRILAL